MWGAGLEVKVEFGRRSLCLSLSSITSRRLKVSVRVDNMFFVLRNRRDQGYVRRVWSVVVFLVVEDDSAKKRGKLVETYWLTLMLFSSSRYCGLPSRRRLRSSFALVSIS
jgi:hypothetical protein